MASTYEPIPPKDPQGLDKINQRFSDLYAQKEVFAKKADLASEQGASTIGISDANGSLASGNVEGALQELGGRHRHFSLGLSNGTSFILPNMSSGSGYSDDIHKTHIVKVLAMANNYVYQKTLLMMVSWNNLYTNISTLSSVFVGASENNFAFEISQTTNYITDLKITNNSGKDTSVHVYDFCAH